MVRIATHLLIMVVFISNAHASGKVLWDEIKQCVDESYWDRMKKHVSVESNFNPIAINVNKGKLKRQPASIEEAKYWAKYLFERGYSVDLGVAQINSQHFKSNGVFGKIGFTVEDAFDPCLNLRMGAYIYGKAYHAAGKDHDKAASIYNSGNTITGFKNGYVNKINSIKDS